MSIKKPTQLSGLFYSLLLSNYFLSISLTSTITANNPTNPEFPKVSIKLVTLPTTSIPNTAPPKSTCTKMPRAIECK